MIRSFLVTAVVAIAALATPVAAQTDKLPNLVTVTGEGQVSIAPDLAMLSSGVTTTGKTAREASEANAKMMSAVMGALKALGISEQDIQTTRLSLFPLRDNKNNDIRIIGFQAANQVTVKIRDTGKTADVIDRLVGAGANDISGLQFVVSAPSKPLDQAREAAIADARRKAEVYARAANVKLGAATSITEEGSVAPGPMPMRMAKEATPISPGEQVQKISVSVSYELLR